MRSLNYETEEVSANGFIRSCVAELKKEHRCYCYFEWQVKEITSRYKSKYKGEINARKINNYYLLQLV